MALPLLSLHPLHLSPLITIAYIPAFWLLILLLTTIYRLSPWHPLASFPGPPLAKVTKWWMAYHAIVMDTHEVVRRAHLRYGDIVRIGELWYMLCSQYELISVDRLGPNELSFARADAIQPIFIDKTCVKGPCECPGPSLSAFLPFPCR